MQPLKKKIFELSDDFFFNYNFNFLSHLIIFIAPIALNNPEAFK